MQTLIAKVWVRLIVVFMLLLTTVLLTADEALAITDSESISGTCGEFWPTDGQFETQHTGGNTYVTEFSFTLTHFQIQNLECVDPFLEIDFKTQDFDFPNNYDEYMVVSTNLPDALHDVNWDDNDPTPAVTNITVAELQPGVEYSVVLSWDYLAGQNPAVSVAWVPSHWSGEDVWGTSIYNVAQELASCEVGDTTNNDAWCIFGTTRVLLSQNLVGWLPFNGYNSWSFSPSVSWSQYIGDIVRWTDGTSWLVQDGGRYWIPTGGDYLCFVAQGAQVYNLSSSELDAIPDNWGSHAICNPIGSGTSGTSTPPVIERIAFVSVGDVLVVKQGPLDAAWVVEAPGVASFQLEGNRIAYLDNAGVLRAKEGALDAAWVTLSTGVTDFELDGDRIAIRQNTSLSVKEGALSTPWVLLASNSVKDFDIDGNRVGWLSTGNTLYVKQGALNAAWVTLNSGVSDFQLEGNRVGIRQGTSLSVKEGALNSAWVTLIGNWVADFQLEGDRVAWFSTGNSLYVKEGSLGSAWVTLNSGVSEFELEGDRVGIRQGSSLSVKEGALTTPWVLQMNNSVASFDLAGDRIGFVSTGNSLYAKEGSLGSAWITEATGYVDQLQLLVDSG